MQIFGFSFEMTIPNVGGRPPLLHLDTQVSVRPFHIVVMGAVAAAIVWVAHTTSQRPVKSSTEPSVEPEPFTGARLTRA